MPIFPRRVIQSLIDASSKFLTDGQAVKFAGDLNRERKPVAPWEWELALLSALGKLGDVRYQPRLGTRTPDILFSLKAPPNGSFVGEITTVSDRWAHQQNPIDKLALELSRRVRENGLNPNSFSMRVGAFGPGEKANRVRSLKIPQEHQFSRLIFNSSFRAFLHNVKSRPNEASTLHLKTNRVDVRIAYGPRQRFSSRSYNSYDLPRSIERNIVFSALKAKAQQFRGCSHPGPFGIFLCDAGCKALRKSTGAAGITAERIISRFLQKHKFVSFIQLFTVSRIWLEPSGITSVVVDTRIFAGQSFDALNEDLRKVLMELHRHLPEPETTPSEARITQIKRQSDVGRSFRGRCAIKHNGIKFSARVLLEYLAGRIDHEKFLAQAGLSNGRDNAQIYNLFERWLVEGRLLSEIALEKCPEKDDDWIVLKLSEPDAAISEFKPPQKVGT